MTVPAPNATPTFNPDECVRLGRKVNYNNAIPLVDWLTQDGPGLSASTLRESPSLTRIHWNTASRGELDEC